jgi:hypothetical protein
MHCLFSNGFALLGCNFFSLKENTEVCGINVKQHNGYFAGIERKIKMEKLKLTTSRLAG